MCEAPKVQMSWHRRKTPSPAREVVNYRFLALAPQHDQHQILSSLQTAAKTNPVASRVVGVDHSGIHWFLFLLTAAAAALHSATYAFSSCVNRTAAGVLANLPVAGFLHLRASGQNVSGTPGATIGGELTRCGPTLAFWSSAMIGCELERRGLTVASLSSATIGCELERRGLTVASASAPSVPAASWETMIVTWMWIPAWAVPAATAAT